MTIHLSRELEKFVHDAVRDGLFAREDDVIRDALLRLKQTMSGKKTKRAKPAQQKQPLTRAEFDQNCLTVTDFGEGAGIIVSHAVARSRCLSWNSLQGNKLNAPIFRQPTTVQ